MFQNICQQTYFDVSQEVFIVDCFYLKTTFIAKVIDSFKILKPKTYCIFLYSDYLRLGVSSLPFYFNIPLSLPSH